MNSVSTHINCKNNPPKERSCSENLGHFKADLLLFFEFLCCIFLVEDRKRGWTQKQVCQNTEYIWRQGREFASSCRFSANWASEPEGQKIPRVGHIKSFVTYPLVTVWLAVDALWCTRKETWGAFWWGVWNKNVSDIYYSLSHMSRLYNKHPRTL